MKTISKSNLEEKLNLPPQTRKKITLSFRQVSEEESLSRRSSAYKYLIL